MPCLGRQSAFLSIFCTLWWATSVGSPYLSLIQHPTWSDKKPALFHIPWIRTGFPFTVSFYASKTSSRRSRSSHRQEVSFPSPFRFRLTAFRAFIITRSSYSVSLIRYLFSPFFFISRPLSPFFFLPYIFYQKRALSERIRLRTKVPVLLVQKKLYDNVKIKRKIKKRKSLRK